VSSSLLVLALSSESKLVLWLSVWDFVDSEPFVCSPQKTGKVSLNIFYVVKLRSQWVVDVNDDDFPVSLLLIKESHDTENLDLLDLTWVSDQFTDLANIQWVIVTLGLGFWVDDIRIFPSLFQRQLRVDGSYNIEDPT
jgi:hypothetical protein